MRNFYIKMINDANAAKNNPDDKNAQPKQDKAAILKQMADIQKIN